MKKVILIDNEPFTRRRDELFYISRLRNDGFAVEVWDLSRLFTRGRNLPDRIQGDYIREFHNINEVTNAIQEISITDTFVIVEIDKGDVSYPIYQELQRNRCVTGHFDFYSNILPSYHIDLSAERFLSWQFIQNLYIKIRNYINWRLYLYKWRKIKNFDYYLSPINKAEVTGHINHPDYNDYVFHREPPKLDYDYFVFCDNYFPNHPDLKGIADHISAKIYQDTLSRFFDYLEQHTSTPVIIAAHPKASYNGKEFGNRRILKYCTNNLVSHSNGIIIHSSNSISYAIMANKQILCVTTDDYSSVVHLDTMMKKNCEYMKISLHNIDHEDYEKISFEHVSPEIRNQYIYSFLTSKETENRDNYDIIKSTILSAYNQ